MCLILAFCLLLGFVTACTARSCSLARLSVEHPTTPTRLPKPRRRPRAPDASARFSASIKATIATRLTVPLSSMDFTLLTDVYDVAPLVALLVQHLPATAQAMADSDLNPPFCLVFHRLPIVCPAATFELVFAAIEEHSQQVIAANAVVAPVVPVPAAGRAAAPAAADPLAVAIARLGV